VPIVLWPRLSLHTESAAASEAINS